MRVGRELVTKKKKVELWEYEALVFKSVKTSKEIGK